MSKKKSCMVRDRQTFLSLPINEVKYYLRPEPTIYLHNLHLCSVETLCVKSHQICRQPLPLVIFTINSITCPAPRPRIRPWGRKCLLNYTSVNLSCLQFTLGNEHLKNREKFETTIRANNWV